VPRGARQRFEGPLDAHPQPLATISECLAQPPRWEPKKQTSSNGVFALRCGSQLEYFAPQLRLRLIVPQPVLGYNDLV
jgi:hypothetical protein